MSRKHILVPVIPADVLDSVSAVHRLLKAFLGGRKAETITAYRQDLEDFQAFIKAPSLEQAASLLLTRQGEANALALNYKGQLMDRLWHLHAAPAPEPRFETGLGRQARIVF
jgi:hypothetical protein